MGVATTCAPNGLGPSNPTKKLAHWVDLLDQPLSRNHDFEIFRGEPPLINPRKIRVCVKSRVSRFWRQNWFGGLMHVPSIVNTPEHLCVTKNFEFVSSSNVLLWYVIIMFMKGNIFGRLCVNVFVGKYANKIDEL